jgi:hypothetical protein
VTGLIRPLKQRRHAKKGKDGGDRDDHLASGSLAATVRRWRRANTIGYDHFGSGAASSGLQGSQGVLGFVFWRRTTLNDSAVPARIRSGIATTLLLGAATDVWLVRVIGPRTKR